MSRRLSLIVALAACGRARHVDSCDDALDGVWLAAGGRWMMLDNGATLEAYPMFDDAIRRQGDVVIAPRVIDLRRGGGQLSGTVARRYMRRGDLCDARATVLITACHDDVLELELAGETTPQGFAPCSWRPATPDHGDRWRRD